MIAQRLGAIGRWYVVAGVAWLVRYATLAHIPVFQQPIWRDWFDQSRYVASATAFAHGDLSAGAHWYPLGYPLLAAPFAWVLPGDPFFLLDLILFLLACKAFQNVAARLGIGPWPATLCFLATTLVQTGLAGAWAQPWTTTLSATLIWWLIDRTLHVGDGIADSRRTRTRTRTRTLLAVGALAMALPLVRPVDALIGLTCLAVAAATLWRRHRLSVDTALPVVAGGAIVGGLYALLHLGIYGPHPTPYMAAAANTGFIWSDLGWKAHVLLVHARPWYPDSDAMLERLPWIVPGCAGLIALAFTGQRRERDVVLLLFAVMLPVSAIMLTYADLQPPGLWYFGNVHYFKWTMPAFGAGLVLCWRQLGKSAERRVLAAVLVVLLLPLTIRIVPRVVNEATPARMLLFRGTRHRDWQEAYFASVEITDVNGRLHNVGDFHQIPDASGERAVAISRLFASRPRRTDPGEPLVGARQLPYARFGERLSFMGY